MNVTLNHLTTIFKTLPTGYYLGRRLEHEMTEGPVSYFDPVNDKIVIGASMIIQALKNVNEDDDSVDVESIIRSLLYHEVSHAILTPQNLYKNNHKYKDVINLFEDERIETLLKNFYVSVDFKKNVVLLNNFKGEEPKSGWEAFYQLVRYHIGKPYFLGKVAKIISKYKHINASFDANYNYDVSQYVDAIIKLYQEFSKDWEEEKKNQQQSQNGDSDSTDNNDTSSNSDGSSDSDGENKSSKNTSNNSDDSDDSADATKSRNPGSGDINSLDRNSNANDSTETISSQNGDDDNKSNSEEPFEVKDLNIDATNKDIEKLVEKAISTTVNKYYDGVLIQKLNTIIERKLKQHEKNGSAIASYCGKITPKLVGTKENYTWWSQQNRMGNIRRFSKVHFTLVLDNSGSFSNNDDKMNTFLKSLSAINNPDFSFDVVTINSCIREWDTNNQIFRSSGGTYLQNSIGTILKKHNRLDANNYRIVLFDGDANPDGGTGSNNTFKYFNDFNSIVVTDKENEKYLKSFNKMKKVIISDSNYCNKFIDEILTLLDRVM